MKQVLRIYMHGFAPMVLLLLFSVDLVFCQEQVQQTANAQVYNFDSVKDNLDRIDVSRSADAIFLSFSHIVVILVCVILFRRTAAGTLGSRFLNHIANSYAVTAFFYLGNIAYHVSISFLLSEYGVPRGQGLKELGEGDLQALGKSLDVITSSWVVTDVLLSLFSTFWLLLAWHLVKNLPAEGVVKDFYVGLVGSFGAALSGIVLSVQAFGASIEIFLVCIDVIFATLAMVLIGLELGTRLKPPPNRRMWAHLTILGYLSWALLQPIYAVYILLGWTPPAMYFGALLITKLLAAIFTIILATIVLDEKPEFSST